MKTPRLTVLCGLQGSGKSTYAKSLKAEVVSSDAIRKEFPGIKNDTTFQKVYERINKLLSEGKNVVLDATNITNKSRRQVFQNVKVPCKKICVIFNIPYNICLERVRERNKKGDEHFVPEEVVENYYHSFQIPFYEEGWDEIRFIYEPTEDESVAWLGTLQQMAIGFNQNNKHHTQDLGQHLESTGRYLENVLGKCVLTQAGYCHDLGKLFTQTVGKDGQCHYYNHENVGAYNLMCKCGIFNFVGEFNTKYTLKWLFLINYHMIFKDEMSEKSRKKWENIFGQFKTENLTWLHDADMSTHTV